MCCVPHHRWKLFTPRLPTVVIVTAAVALAWFATSYLTRNDVGPSGQYPFHLPGSRHSAFFRPILVGVQPATFAMATGYFLSLWAMLYVRRATLRVDFLMASSVIMFVLYLLFPSNIPGSGSVDVRWLPAAYLLLFCSRERGPEEEESLLDYGRERTPEMEPVLALLVPFFACVVHAALIGRTAHKIDRYSTNTRPRSRTYRPTRICFRWATQ